MITENVSTLKINKLTKAQYDRELAAGTIDENALYLTPDEAIDLSGYATTEQIDGLQTELDSKADVDHAHNLGENLTGGVANDTVSFWKNLGFGVAWVSEKDQIVAQPSQYGFVINYVNGNDVFQIFRDQEAGVTYFRSGDNVNDWFQSWREVVAKDEDGGIHTNGLYASHVEVTDGNTTMGLYSNGLGANGDAVWIDHAGDAYFTEVNIGTKGNYKKVATQEAVDAKADAAELDNKQDIIAGTEGQIVGFDSDGNPVATDALNGYLSLAGGEMFGSLSVIDAPLRIMFTNDSFDPSEITGATLSVSNKYTTDYTESDDGTCTPSGMGVGDDVLDIDTNLALSRGSIHMHNHRIQGLANPEHESDAVNRRYLDKNMQTKITGTPGQFVVIGDDGNPTTKTIANAEEASF